jgi:hypothetical protein
MNAIRRKKYDKFCGVWSVVKEKRSALVLRENSQIGPLLMQIFNRANNTCRTNTCEVLRPVL